MESTLPILIGSQALKYYYYHGTPRDWDFACNLTKNVSKVYGTLLTKKNLKLKIMEKEIRKIHFIWI